MTGAHHPERQLIAFRAIWDKGETYLQAIRQAGIGCSSLRTENTANAKVEALSFILGDVVQWFGDTCWLPTQVGQGRQSSGQLKTFDHCALTIEHYLDSSIVRFSENAILCVKTRAPKRFILRIGEQIKLLHQRFWARVNFMHMG